MVISMEKPLVVSPSAGGPSAGAANAGRTLPDESTTERDAESAFTAGIVTTASVQDGDHQAATALVTYNTAVARLLSICISF